MKDVVITGAYGGMGRALTLLLKEKGYRVFALDKNIGEAEDGIVPIVTDVTDPTSVENAFSVIKGYTDSIFAVIHFAGIYMLNSLVEMSDGDFDRIFEVNVRGAFLVNKSAMPYLKSGSRIIITTSELAPLDPLPFTGIYAVTKAALEKYAYSLCMELQLLGISVSVIRAGAVSTGMLGVSVDALDKFIERTKLYSCNAERFKKIVDSVEARQIPPEKLAKKVTRVLGKKKPSFAYAINRNPLLLLLNLLPKRLQLGIIRFVLK